MIFLFVKKPGFYFLLTSVFCLLTSVFPAHAQHDLSKIKLNKASGTAQTQSQPINLINADELEYSQSGGIKQRKLTGNVQMKQNDVTLFCDQANQFLDQNTIDATGNVHIL